VILTLRSAGPQMNDASPTASIRIDIISDIVCPWCYIGKHRLEAAIASYAGLGVELHWRPFQLDPNIPEDGLDLRAYTAKKRNEGEVDVNQMLASQAGEELGLTFAWDRIERMPNTRDAHRLIRHAMLYGAQTRMVERLFKAYFCDGADIGDRRRLIELAEDCGIDSYAAEALFAQQDDILTIEEELAITRRFGLPKVPCFVFADDIVVPGAASMAAFTAALFRAEETQIGPSTPLS
jgi:predicted DsbA family dithiol-disulfide isomerase